MWSCQTKIFYTKTGEDIPLVDRIIRDCCALNNVCDCCSIWLNEVGILLSSISITMCSFIILCYKVRCRYSGHAFVVFQYSHALPKFTFAFQKLWQFATISKIPFSLQNRLHFKTTSVKPFYFTVGVVTSNHLDLGTFCFSSKCTNTEVTIVDISQTEISLIVINMGMTKM